MSSGEAVAIDEADLRQSIVEPDLPVIVPVMLQKGEDVLRGNLTIYYCEAVNQSLCFIEQVSIEAPVTVGDGDSQTVLLEHTIVPPKLDSSGL